MSIQVPRERQLAGRQIADFQKERARIDDLARPQSHLGPGGDSERPAAIGRWAQKLLR